MKPIRTSSSGLSSTGRSLLDRRRFLGQSLSGLAGIALAQLLIARRTRGEEGQSEISNLKSQIGDGKSPIRPIIRPEAPYAARLPHFATRAKRVLVIFCSGAVSHVDTFDYKPELIKRNGMPMPGA